MLKQNIDKNGWKHQQKLRSQEEVAGPRTSIEVTIKQGLGAEIRCGLRWMAIESWDFHMI